MNALGRKTPESAVNVVRWREPQAALLRQGRVHELDLENLAEEVESVGRSDKREVDNRLTVWTHLLKLEFQPDERARRWLLTIQERRRRLRLVLADGPSLEKTHVPNILGAVYHGAKRKAATETRLDRSAFPERVPYSLEHLLDGSPEG